MRPSIFVLVAAAFGAWSFSASDAQSADQLAEAAAYISRIQDIIEHGQEVMIETRDFERMAVEVIDRSLSESNASESADRIEKELLGRLDEVAAELDALPPVPGIIRSGSLLRGISATVDSARENIRITRESIVIGRSLVESAVNGSQDALREGRIRALNAGLAQIFADTASVRASVSNQKPDTPAYHLGRTQLANIAMIKTILQSYVEVLTAEEDEFVDRAADVLVEELEEHAEILKIRAYRGRNIVSDNERAIESFGEQGGNVELLSRALATFDRSFRVEERLSEIIYEYGQYLVGRNFDIESDQVREYTARMSALEDERIRLERTRREILSNLN